MPREDDFGEKEQDRYLPIANVSRIMKKGLPVNAKIAKDAKECVQDCVSEFIAFVTSEASDRCAQEKRKTINGEDIIWALQSLGFENYTNALKIYLAKYRDASKVERGSLNKSEEEMISSQEFTPMQMAQMASLVQQQQFAQAQAAMQQAQQQQNQQFNSYQ